MGALSNSCIYDSFYPCDFGCDNKSCRFYSDEREEDCDEGEQDE